MGLAIKIFEFKVSHQQIVARFFGDDNAYLITKFIGIGEIFIACWILSGIKRKEVVLLQIILVVTMNILEFFKANDLLQWGSMNSIFAFLFVSVLYYNEFILKPKL